MHLAILGTPLAYHRFGRLQIRKLIQERSAARGRDMRSFTRKDLNWSGNRDMLCRKGRMREKMHNKCTSLPCRLAALHDEKVESGVSQQSSRSRTRDSLSGRMAMVRPVKSQSKPMYHCNKEKGRVFLVLQGMPMAPVRSMKSCSDQD